MLHALTGVSAARTAVRSVLAVLATIVLAAACSQPAAVAPAAAATAAAGIVDRMYALDVASSKDKLPPVTLSATVNGSNSTDGKVRFDAAYEQQRVGLLLQDGVVYAAFSSYYSRMPYQGWILGYQAKDLRQAVVYTDNPDPA